MHTHTHHIHTHAHPRAHTHTHNDVRNDCTVFVDVCHKHVMDNSVSIRILLIFYRQNEVWMNVNMLLYWMYVVWLNAPQWCAWQKKNKKKWHNHASSLSQFYPKYFQVIRSTKNKNKNTEKRKEKNTGKTTTHTLILTTNTHTHTKPHTDWQMIPTNRSAGERTDIYPV